MENEALGYFTQISLRWGSM